jgi:uncharacterized membrane protein YfcA
MSGLLGIGGGVVMVPLMVLLLGEGQRHAHAISLAAIVPMSLAAIDVPAAAALTIGAVFGARLGAGLLLRIPERPLKAAFGVTLLLAGVLLVVQG